MPGQVVDPSLLAELRHAGVDEGVPRARLLPRLEQLLVAVGMCVEDGLICDIGSA